jgi:hypothetical protein
MPSPCSTTNSPLSQSPHSTLCLACSRTSTPSHCNRCSPPASHRAAPATDRHRIAAPASPRPPHARTVAPPPLAQAAAQLTRSASTLSHRHPPALVSRKHQLPPLRPSPPCSSYQLLARQHAQPPLAQLTHVPAHSSLPRPPRSRSPRSPAPACPAPAPPAPP